MSNTFFPKFVRLFFCIVPLVLSLSGCIVVHERPNAAVSQAERFPLMTTFLRSRPTTAWWWRLPHLWSWLRLPMSWWFQAVKAPSTWCPT